MFIISGNFNAAVTRLTALAALASALIAVSLPIGYFLTAYSRELGAMGAEAQADSFFVSKIATENPELWQYQRLRLEDTLDRRPRGGVKENRGVLDNDGRMIIESADELGWPLMRQAYPVLDAGRPVGTIVITRSFRPVILKTSLVALVSTALAGVIFYLIRILPIRSVQRAEDRLMRYAQELEDTNADLHSFVYSLSHDLRSPLVNIKGFSGELTHVLKDLETLLNQGRVSFSGEEWTRLKAMLQQEIPATLGFIGSAADKMSELVNAVLKLSRAGRTQLKPEKIDMEALVHAAVKRESAAVNGKNADVSVGALPQVVADRQAMEQIIGTLLENALKYLVPGRAGRVEIRGEWTASETTFHVQDNGRGIAEEDLQKVFGMFRRAGQQDVPGEGMGLAYARTLVRRYGGRIWCESQPGAGSTFSFTVPHPASYQ